MSDEIPDGFVRNCYLQPRRRDAEDWLFHATGNTVIARLDGYAIIPKEEYERLKALDVTTGQLRRRAS